MDSRSSEPSPEVVAVLADFLRRVEAGEPADLDAVCAAHPGIAAELRALVGHWNAVGGVRTALGIGGSVGRGLRERYGSDADPHVSLDREEPGSSADEFARGVVGRLGARSGAFGRYRLSGELARGGQGVVLRVWDEDLRRSLATTAVRGSRGRGHCSRTSDARWPPRRRRVLAVLGEGTLQVLGEGRTAGDAPGVWRGDRLLVELLALEGLEVPHQAGELCLPPVCLLAPLRVGPLDAIVDARIGGRPLLLQARDPLLGLQ